MKISCPTIRRTRHFFFIFYIYYIISAAFCQDFSLTLVRSGRTYNTMKGKNNKSNINLISFLFSIIIIPRFLSFVNIFFKEILKIVANFLQNLINLRSFGSFLSEFRCEILRANFRITPRNLRPQAAPQFIPLFYGSCPAKGSCDLPLYFAISGFSLCLGFFFGEVRRKLFKLIFISFDCVF